MFLFHLTPRERTAFAGLAKHLIVVDGAEAPAETAALQLLEAELGIAVASIPAMAPTAEVLGAFAGTASKAAALIELLALAYADGLPHPEEMEVLRKVAVGMGISEMRLLEMEDWVVKQLPRNAEAMALLLREE